MRAPPLIRGATRALPQRRDPVALRTELVAAQVGPLLASYEDVYLWADRPLTLPSGLVTHASLVACPAPSGSLDNRRIARATLLIVDVVAEDADTARLETARAEYVTLPKLIAYIRVGLTLRAVVVYARADGWERRVYTRGEAPLPGLGGGLRVAALYP